jgi:hypothetical protein
VYGLLNVIGVIAVLKFFRQGGLGDPGTTEQRDPAQQARP